MGLLAQVLFATLATTLANIDNSGICDISDECLLAANAVDTDEAYLKDVWLLQFDQELTRRQSVEAAAVSHPVAGATQQLSQRGSTTTAIPPQAEAVEIFRNFSDTLTRYVTNAEPDVEVPLRWFKSGIWAHGRPVLARRNATLPLTVSNTFGQAADRVHKLALGVMLPATGIFMLDLVVGRVLRANNYTRHIPETLLTFLVAVLLGFAMRHLIAWGFLSLTDFTLVDATILNLFLLPIIIFNTAWAMNLPHFVSQLPYILIFAILGTGITMLVIGWSSWYLAQWGFHEMTGLRENFAFAVLISATDSVATLATFAQFNIADKQPLLNMLVMGESILNDAVAIATFKVINSFEAEGSLVWSMFVQLFGSMAFGLGLAGLLVLVMRLVTCTGSHNNTVDVLFLFLTPYFVFSLSESLELSGIISTLFAGIIMQKYGRQLLSKEGEMVATELFEAMSRLADNGVFILCGTSTALMTSSEGVLYGLIAVILCLMARAVAVLFCSGMTNGIKRMTDDYPHIITRGQMFMVWLSGLRGGIALVLALELDSTWIAPEDKSLIVNSTFIVICVMLLVCGTATEPCLHVLELMPKPGQLPAIQRDLSDSMLSSRLPFKMIRWLDGILSAVLLGGQRRAPGDQSEDELAPRSPCGTRSPHGGTPPRGGR